MELSHNLFTVHWLRGLYFTDGPASNAGSVGLMGCDSILPPDSICLSLLETFALDRFGCCSIDYSPCRTNCLFWSGIGQQKILICLSFCLFCDDHRQISGAMIRISNCEDRESSTERTITITGSAESVALAQYLINTRLDVWPNRNSISCVFFFSSFFYLFLFESVCLFVCLSVSVLSCSH